MPRIDLDALFPAAPPHIPHQPKPTKSVLSDDIRQSNGGKARKEIPTRWASIYALELRGLNANEIAQSMGLSVGGISRITTDPRYIAYREEHLTALDAEFIAMKPLAFNALKSGLNSSDENTALRASEQWFKGAGFGGFNKDPKPVSHLTAEDVVAALIATQTTNVQVNVQVNTEKD